jgi:hypothetical protein
MRYKNVFIRVGRALCLLFVATTSAAFAGGSADEPVKLTIPAERIEGIGQTDDPAATAVTIHRKASPSTPVRLPIVADTFLWKQSKNSAGFGQSLLLRDGRFSQGLMKIDVSGLDPDAAFDAGLHFKVGGVERKGQSATFSLHRILTDWTEDATWFKPTAEGDTTWDGLKPGRDYDANPFAQLKVDALKDNQLIDITGIETAIRSWRSGQWPNHGFLILLNGKALQCVFPSREKAMQARSVVLGGQNSGAMLIVPNAGVLARVLLKPDDLLTAELKLVVLKRSATTKGSAPPTITLELLRALRPITDGPLKAGIDFDASPLATCDLPATGSETTIHFPGLADLLRQIAGGKSANDGLIVRVSSSQTAPLSIGGPADSGRLPALAITAQPSPHPVLYDPSIKPTPGVYTTLKDGHLYYGQQRLRLWGVVGAPHPDRLVKMGFNAERIWEPRVEISKNKTNFYTAESLKRGEAATYTKGDGSMIDQWDRRFADDKAHGLFVMFAALQNGMPVVPLAADDSFIAPGHEPGSDAGDWQAWKKAILTPKIEPLLPRIAVIDDRLLAIRKRAARNLLTHVNQYTGKPYGQDEAIAVYEVFNENGFCRVALEGEYEKWPAFFQEEFRAKWNGWLKGRYHDDAALMAAWGKTAAGESLAQSTVKLGPTLQNRASASPSRASDFVRFVIEIDHHFQEDFRAYCRTLAPPGIGVNVAPFSFDTQYRPHMAWNYANSLGDVNCFGMYFWELSSSLSRPPSAYVIDSNTTQGAATILYETNCGRPDPYRAEYPLKLAALASWQDWDGIFWHYWSQSEEPDEAYLTTPMAPPAKSHYWTAVQHQNDPVMCSAMSIAGQIFLRHDIHPATQPAVFEVGAKALFGYDHYAGAGVARQTFVRGATIRFRADSPSGISLDGAAPPENQPLTDAVASGDQILWDWPNGRLIIDTPTAKAYVGKFRGPFKFKDGIVLGDVSTPSVSFAMASRDGKPLVGPDASHQIYVMAVADARNTDFRFNYDVKGGPLEQANAVSNRGRAPVLVDPVHYRVWFPANLQGSFAEYDFADRQVRSQPISNINVIRQAGPTPYMSILTIENRQSPAAVPEPAPASVVHVPQMMVPTPLPASQPAGPWNPIPEISWQMNEEDADRALHGSGLTYSSISREKSADGATKALIVSDVRLPALWGSPADVELSFSGHGIGSITVTLKQPPPFSVAMEDLQKRLGPPAEKQTGAQFERSLARWDKVDRSVDVIMTESQGILKLVLEKN